MKNEIEKCKRFIREKGVPVAVGILIGHMNWHVWAYERAVDGFYYIEAELGQDEPRTLWNKINPFDGK